MDEHLLTDTSDQLGPKIAGDWKDDDAAILDSQVESHAAPPTPAQLPQTPHPTPISGPKPITRLLTGSLAIAASWDAPQLILPADPYRTSLQLWAASDTATDYARLADDAGKAQSQSASALLYSGQLLPFPLNAAGCHTGPVWAYAPDATGPVTISWLAVTK